MPACSTHHVSKGCSGSAEIKISSAKFLWQCQEGRNQKTQDPGSLVQIVELQILPLRVKGDFLGKCRGVKGKQTRKGERERERERERARERERESKPSEDYDLFQRYPSIPRVFISVLGVLAVAGCRDTGPPRRTLTLLQHVQVTVQPKHLFLPAP